MNCPFNETNHCAWRNTCLEKQEKSREPALIGAEFVLFLFILLLLLLHIWGLIDSNWSGLQQLISTLRNANPVPALSVRVHGDSERARWLRRWRVCCAGAAARRRWRVWVGKARAGAECVCVCICVCVGITRPPGEHFSGLRAGELSTCPGIPKTRRRPRTHRWMRR